jgi:hypothetical protein
MADRKKGMFSIISLGCTEPGKHGQAPDLNCAISFSDDGVFFTLNDGEQSHVGGWANPGILRAPFPLF